MFFTVYNVCKIQLYYTVAAAPGIIKSGFMKDYKDSLKYSIKNLLPVCFFNVSK